MTENVATGGRRSAGPSAVAWVPERKSDEWDDAADLAVTWLDSQMGQQAAAPIVVTATLKNTLPDALAHLAARGAQISPQSHHHVTPSPVAAYVPDVRCLHLATTLARGYPLVVIEGTQYRLAEWAAGIGAINLHDGTTRPSDLPDDVTSDLDATILFGGRNGWSGSHEKADARTRLSSHVQCGTLTPDQAGAYAMARNVSDRGVRTLIALLERAR